MRDFSAVETAAIKRESIFQGGTSGAVNLPAGAEITNATVRLVYLTVDAGGNMAAMLYKNFLIINRSAEVNIKKTNAAYT